MRQQRTRVAAAATAGFKQGAIVKFDADNVGKCKGANQRKKVTHQQDKAEQERRSVLHGSILTLFCLLFLFAFCLGRSYAYRQA
jgi:hypothetical protein